MAEILTESFCERCGTRYTFESAAPKPRLGRFKTLSRGLKNFVLDDQASLDDALAAARNDIDREATAQQLDAFHKTFNFCMSCRQYTCANCWNAAAGECQSCSPLAGAGFAAWADQPANGPRPEAAEAPGIEATAWPSADLRRTKPTPAPGLASDIAAASSLAELLSQRAASDAPDSPPASSAEPEPASEQPEPELDGEMSPLARLEAFRPTKSPKRPTRATPPVAPAPPPATAEPTAEAPASTEEAPTVEPDVEERAAAARAATSGLLSRFRPGQSLDEALAAYEAGLPPEPPRVEADQPVVAEDTPRDAEPAPESVAWTESEEPVAWSPDGDAEPVAVSDPELEAAIAAARASIEWPAEPEPVASAEPEPVAWPEAEPLPPPAAPAPPADDVVELPTWRVRAPQPEPNGHPSESLPAAASALPGDRATPQWPGQTSESFLAARLAAHKSGDAMWAASSADVVRATAAAGTAVPVGVQGCVSCGLSLSATARFCRRCGTRQA